MGFGTLQGNKVCTCHCSRILRQGLSREDLQLELVTNSLTIIACGDTSEENGPKGNSGTHGGGVNTIVKVETLSM